MQRIGFQQEIRTNLIRQVVFASQHWALHSLPYPLVLATLVAPSLLDFSRSLLDWMSDSVAKAFQASRENAFELK